MKINGLQNYDPFERPIENVSQPLQVKVRMLLNQILDIVRFAFLLLLKVQIQDEKNQQMAVLAYVDYVNYCEKNSFKK